MALAHIREHVLSEFERNETPSKSAVSPAGYAMRGQRGVGAAARLEADQDGRERRGKSRRAR
jgi:hypothetical protein